MKRSIKNELKNAQGDIAILTKQLINCIKYINCLVVEVAKLKNEHKFEKEYESLYIYDLTKPVDNIDPNLNEIKDYRMEASSKGYKFLKSLNLLSECFLYGDFQDKAGLYEKVNTNERI